MIFNHSPFASQSDALSAELIWCLKLKSVLMFAAEVFVGIDNDGEKDVCLTELLLLLLLSRIILRPVCFN